MWHGFTWFFLTTFTVTELLNFNILETQVNIGIWVSNLHTHLSQSKYICLIRRSVYTFTYVHILSLSSLAREHASVLILLLTSSLWAMNVVGLPREFHVCTVQTFSRIKPLYWDTCILISSVLVLWLSGPNLKVIPFTRGAPGFSTSVCQFT